jgi:acyl-CoA synthetase (AMP-forming)/AMP-acid ligase II
MIIDHIYRWARGNPNKTAVIYNDSYGEFAKSIERTRQFLTRQQLSQGSPAALLIQNLLAS